MDQVKYRHRWVHVITLSHLRRALSHVRRCCVEKILDFYTTFFQLNILALFKIVSNVQG